MLHEKKLVRCSENMKRAHFVSADVVCVKGWAVGGNRTGKTSLALTARQPRIQPYMGLDACEKP